MLQSLITFLQSHVPASVFTGLFFLSIFIDVSKIKFDPWKSLFRSVGKYLTEDISKRLDLVEEQQEKQNRKIDENKLDDIRWDFLNFANSCINQVPHTKDEFDHAVEQGAKYNRILAQYPDIKNDVFTSECDYVLKLYEHNMKTNSFLKESDYYVHKDT